MDVCPVNMFEMYISKLNPDYKYLWQRPKKGTLSFYAPAWYDKQRLGQDTISKFMRNLSESAKLSKIYTNHCIRKTRIVILDNSGFEARHIIALSSHKSEATIKEYSENCPDEKREEMFEALAQKIQPQQKVTARKRSETQSKPNDNDNNYLLPAFDTDPEEDSILENFLRNTQHLDNNDFLLHVDTNKENRTPKFKYHPASTTTPFQFSKYYTEIQQSSSKTLLSKHDILKFVSYCEL